MCPVATSPFPVIQTPQSNSLLLESWPAASGLPFMDIKVDDLLLLGGPLSVVPYC